MNTTLTVFLLAVLSKAQATPPSNQHERRYTESTHRTIVVTEAENGQKHVHELRAPHSSLRKVAAQ